MTRYFECRSAPFDPDWLDKEGLMTHALDHLYTPAPGEAIPVKLGYQLLTVEQADALVVGDATDRSPQMQHLLSFAGKSVFSYPPEFRIEPNLVLQDVRWSHQGYTLNAKAHIRHNRLNVYAVDRQGQRIDSPVALLDRRVLFYHDIGMAWGSVGTHARIQYDLPNLRRSTDWIPVYRADLYAAIVERQPRLYELFRDHPTSKQFQQDMAYLGMPGTTPVVKGIQDFWPPQRSSLDDILFYQVFGWYYQWLVSPDSSVPKESLVVQMAQFVHEWRHASQMGVSMRELFHGDGSVWLTANVRSIYHAINRAYDVGCYPLLKASKK